MKYTVKSKITGNEYNYDAGTLEDAESHFNNVLGFGAYEFVEFEFVEFEYKSPLKDLSWQTVPPGAVPVPPGAAAPPPAPSAPVAKPSINYTPTYPLSDGTWMVKGKKYTFHGDYDYQDYIDAGFTDEYLIDIGYFMPVVKVSDHQMRKLKEYMSGEIEKRATRVFTLNAGFGKFGDH